MEAGAGVGLSEELRRIWRHEFDLAAKDGGVQDYGEVWKRIADRYEEARERGQVELEDVSGERSKAWAHGRTWRKR